MSINNSMFGIDSIIPYNLKTGLPISKTPFKVIGSFATNVTQEIIDLMGGSSFDAFDTELGARTFEGTMLLRQYPDALIEIATGVTPTDNAAINPINKGFNPNCLKLENLINKEN